MTTHLEARVIHSYDTSGRRVRCGLVEQSSSTKHARDVTCVTCRGLLDLPHAPVPVRSLAGFEPPEP